MISKKATVSGIVQGVWFRASTQKQAEKLSITGYAKNLANGNVEVLMTGDADDLESLISWLHQGPANAHVDQVEVSDSELQQHGTFETV